MTIKDLFSDAVSVIREVINASAMTPAQKTDLHAKLTGVEQGAAQVAVAGAQVVQTEAADLPEQAEGAAVVTVEKAGALAGPIGGAVAQMAAPVVGTEVQNVAARMLNVFEAHNKSLMADLAAIANPPSA